MKRVFLGACLVFGSFALTGCDSAGIPEGQPDSTKPMAPLIETDMSKGPKMPPGGAAPGKDAPKGEAPGTPPAPNATKK